MQTKYLLCNSARQCNQLLGVIVGTVYTDNGPQGYLQMVSRSQRQNIHEDPSEHLWTEDACLAALTRDIKIRFDV